MRVLGPGVVIGSRKLRRILVSFTSRGARRPVSRVLSVPQNDTGRPFLWDAPHGAPRATNPGGGTGMFLAQPVGLLPAAPIRSCSRWGLPCRPRCRGRGALLPHRFTLACGPFGARAVCFLWHFPWGRPRRPLAGTAFPWSPDFPPPRSRGGGRPAVWQAGRSRFGRPASSSAA